MRPHHATYAVGVDGHHAAVSVVHVRIKGDAFVEEQVLQIRHDRPHYESHEEVHVQLYPRTLQFPLK